MDCYHLAATVLKKHFLTAHGKMKGQPRAGLSNSALDTNMPDLKEMIKEEHMYPKWLLLLLLLLLFLRLYLFCVI